MSVPKIRPPRFSTTLISVEYLTTVKTYRPSHQHLNFIRPRNRSGIRLWRPGRNRRTWQNVEENEGQQNCKERKTNTAYEENGSSQNVNRRRV